MSTDGRRSYPLHQCRLFRTTSPQQLAARLGVKLPDLEALANRADNYKRFKTGKYKKRAVEETKAELQRLHKKVARWLARVETPEYLHSAVKGRSYISNAAAHSAGENLMKVDIRSFFRNVTRQAVFHFFLDAMKCRSDVAMLLAKWTPPETGGGVRAAIVIPLAWVSHEGGSDGGGSAGVLGR